MTITTSSSPIVSTTMWRLRPLIFLPASYPRVCAETVSAPLTDCESTIPAEGSGLRRSSLTRTRSRSASCSRSSVPSSPQARKYQYTVCHGGKSFGSIRHEQPVRVCSSQATQQRPHRQPRVPPPFRSRCLVADASASAPFEAELLVSLLVVRSEGAAHYDRVPAGSRVSRDPWPDQRRLPLRLGKRASATRRRPLEVVVANRYANDVGHSEPSLDLDSDDPETISSNLG